jgi:NifB/MoaA-like Fe-S oxidoreductase
MCGGDLIEEAKKNKAKILFFPAVALRHERDRFLDDVTVEELEKEVGCPVYPIENGIDILDKIEEILYGGEVWQNR